MLKSMLEPEITPEVFIEYRNQPVEPDMPKFVFAPKEAGLVELLAPEDSAA